MKTRKKWSVLLLAALTAQLLSGCRLIIPSDKPLNAPNINGGRYGNSDDWGKESPSGAPSDGSPTQAPDASLAVWNADHTLDIELPAAEGLELPVVGATGLAPVRLYQWPESTFPTDSCKAANLPSGASAVQQLSEGTPFLILEERGDWWLVRANNKVGWVEHRYCFINLPDVIPSIIYDDTNAYASVFRASYKDIPSITDKALYDARAYNARLGREEFVMPVLYAMSKKICQAQQNALAGGNTLVLNEGFRPADTQIQVARAVAEMAKTDAEVKAGISTYPWSISWFIATGISNHQEGYAMDVSLAKVSRSHVETIDGYSFVHIDGYELYRMPTPIHELSKAACTYTAPVSILSRDAWKYGTMSPEMAASEPAKALQRYCTDTGMTPLASEWWHFNDLDSYYMTSANRSKGNFLIDIGKCNSLAPSAVLY